jgi:hypothetical protein
VFNTSHPFQKVSSKIDHSKPHLVSVTLYRFDTDNGNRYLVEVHEHKKKVFVVKFFLKNHKNYNDKFHILTDLWEWGGVLRTVVDICIKIHQDVPDASFAFIGVPKKSVVTNKTEPTNKPNNQRFRVYKKLTETFMGTLTFNHVESEQSNCYLLVNKSNTDHLSLTEEIIQMMANHYQDYGLLLE